MATTNISIRIEESTKRDLESVCRELGMSVTTAFTIFAKKVCREGESPSTSPSTPSIQART